MADPIEIIGTAISVSKTIYGAVKSIKDAPEELKTLDREVSRVLPILGHLVETLGKRSQDDSHDRDTAALQGLCNEARELIDAARGIVGAVNGRSKLRKKEWPGWLLNKSNREGLVKRLQQLNSSIVAYLS